MRHSDDTYRERHINSYIHTIIQFIKNYDRPVTYEEIERQTLIKINENKKLITAIESNPKIEIKNRTLLFKPVYSIRTVKDLEDLIISTGCKFGIEMEKLKDSPIDVKPFVEELIQKNMIFCLKDSDNSEILFYNKVNIDKADEKIKNLFDEINVPNYTDIIKELSAAGIKVEKRYYETKKNIVVKKSKVKKFRRKIKITNTHVKGLDLNDIE